MQIKYDIEYGYKILKLKVLFVNQGLNLAIVSLPTILDLVKSPILL